MIILVGIINKQITEDILNLIQLLRNLLLITLKTLKIQSTIKMLDFEELGFGF